MADSIENITENKGTRAYPQSMPLPRAPGIVIAADLSGPYPVSTSGNRYLLSIIDHCSGWVEYKALPDKSSKGIHDYIFNDYIPHHAIPCMFIS
ncbi:hypothetical protein ABTL79_19070, partial [Acinetobacter baumannii]